MSTLSIQKQMCATCPFRPRSKYAALRESLTICALFEASRICHSTGSNNGINRRTGKPPALCRGARNQQLRYLVAVGFLDKATDDAWNAKARALGIKPNQNNQKARR